MKPLSKVPFPRPPARTWALITASSPPARALALPSRHSIDTPARTNLLGDLLGLRSVGCDTALGHANAVLQPSVSLRLYALDSVCSYRLEQRGGPVFVYRQAALLLDSGLPQWCLLCRQLRLLNRNASWRQRLFGPASTARSRTHVGCADGAGHRPTGAGDVVHGVLSG